MLLAIAVMILFAVALVALGSAFRRPRIKWEGQDKNCQLSDFEGYILTVWIVVSSIITVATMVKLIMTGQG